MSTSSWLPNEWPKTIVLIEQLSKDEEGNNVFMPIGTGFITEYEKFNILVTAKHVVFDKDQKTNVPNLFASFNQKNAVFGHRSVEGMKKHFGIDWSFHSNLDVDLAIIPVLFDPAKDDIKRMSRTLYEGIDVLTEGEEIFFLGFPLGIKMEKVIKPIVRAGIIALIQENRTFLIDANVFPGNSGSPVFLKPSIMDYGTRTFGKIRPAKFIGIISSYISYTDVAISRQTKRTRIVFEENSGLACVYSVSYIQDIFESEDFKRKIEKLTQIHIKKENSKPHST